MNCNGATAGGFTAVLLWSSTIAVSRRLTEDLGALGAAALTCLFSAGLAVLFSLRTKRQRQALMALPAKYLWGCGALFTAYTLLLYLAVGWSRNREETLIVGLLNYLWPALTLLLSLPLLGAKARWTLWPATVLALSGIVLVLLPMGDRPQTRLLSALAANPGAYLTAVLAAVCWALYSNLTRRWAGGTSAGGVAFFLLLTGVLISVAALFSGEERHWDSSTLVRTVFLGTATFLAYSLWDRAMRNGKLALVTSFSYLTPLLSSLISVLYLGVMPGAGLWAGCFLLVAGSWLSWRSLNG